MKTHSCRWSSACALVVALSLVASCASNELARDVAATKGEYSGFLSDYSKLENVTDSHGNQTLRWISPNLNGKSYKKILVNEPGYYPTPKATAQVPLQVLGDIQTYGRKALMDRLAKANLLASEPGPGVARVNIALTGVTSEEQGLKSWELIPVALIKAGVEGVAGTRARDVHMFVESEVVDSVSDKVLAQSVRNATGVPLKGEHDKLTLEHIKPKIDQWTETVVAELVRQLD